MFVNYDGMTVDQMLEKQIELKRKVAQAYQSGMSPGIIGQMQNMLDVLMVEYQSRIASDVEDDRDPDADNVMNIGDVE